MTGVCSALAEQVQPGVWPKIQLLTGGGRDSLPPPRDQGSCWEPREPPGKGVLDPAQPIRNPNEPTRGARDANLAKKKSVLRQQKCPFPSGRMSGGAGGAGMAPGWPRGQQGGDPHRHQGPPPRARGRRSSPPPTPQRLQERSKGVNRKLGIALPAVWGPERLAPPPPRPGGPRAGSARAGGGVPRSPPFAGSQLMTFAG